MKIKKIYAFLILFLCGAFVSMAYAHGVDEDTQTFLLGNSGVAFGPFLYIGAKHMITGYDHLLFLVGVIFFLYKPKEVLLYVSFFTIGHSTTLLLGVLADININAYLIDAIIALSIVYKGFDNLGGFKRFFGKQPNTKAAVLIFGPNQVFDRPVVFKIVVCLGEQLPLVVHRHADRGFRLHDVVFQAAKLVALAAKGVGNIQQRTAVAALMVA